MANVSVHKDEHTRFVHLAEERVNRFKNVCLLVSNLSDSRYGTNEPEAKWYFDQLQERVNVVKGEFFNPMLKRSMVEVDEIPDCPKRLRSNGPKNEAFHRLMAGRMHRLVVLLNLMVNLCNRSHYKFYNNEAKQIFAYLNRIIDTTLSHFVGIGDFYFENDGEESEVNAELMQRGRR